MLVFIFGVECVFLEGGYDLEYDVGVFFGVYFVLDYKIRRLCLIWK